MLQSHGCQRGDLQNRGGTAGFSAAAAGSHHPAHSGHPAQPGTAGVAGAGKQEQRVVREAQPNAHARFLLELYRQSTPLRHVCRAAVATYQI